MLDFSIKSWRGPKEVLKSPGEVLRKSWLWIQSRDLVVGPGRRIWSWIQLRDLVMDLVLTFGLLDYDHSTDGLLTGLVPDNS